MEGASLLNLFRARREGVVSKLALHWIRVYHWYSSSRLTTYEKMIAFQEFCIFVAWKSYIRWVNNPLLELFELGRAILLCLWCHFSI